MDASPIYLPADPCAHIFEDNQILRGVSLSEVAEPPPERPYSLRLEGHVGHIFSLSFDPRPSRRQLVATDGGSAIFWDLANGVRVWKKSVPVTPADTIYTDAAISPNGELTAIAGLNTLEIVSSENGQMIRSFAVRGQPDFFTEAPMHVKWSEDGRALATFINVRKGNANLPRQLFQPFPDATGIIRIWNANNGALELSITTEAPLLSETSPVAFSPERGEIVAVTTKGIEVITISTGEKKVYQSHPDHVITAAHLAPDRRGLAFGVIRGGIAGVEIRRVTDGGIEAFIPTGEIIKKVDLKPEINRLFVVSDKDHLLEIDLREYRVINTSWLTYDKGTAPDQVDMFKLISRMVEIAPDGHTIAGERLRTLNWEQKVDADGRPFGEASMNTGPNGEIETYLYIWTNN